MFVKALIHGDIFHATCLAKRLRNKLHQAFTKYKSVPLCATLDHATCLATILAVVRHIERCEDSCNLSRNVVGGQVMNLITAWLTYLLRIATGGDSAVGFLGRKTTKS